MERPGSSSVRQLIAFTAAGAVQVFFARALLDVWNLPAAKPLSQVATTLAVLPPVAVNNAGRTRYVAPAIRALPSVVATPLIAPGVNFPSPTPRPTTGWGAAASRAAEEIVRQGVMPQTASPSVPFPWSAPTLNFDPTGLVVRIGERCGLALLHSQPHDFFALAKGSCALGRLPDSARADIFEPKLVPPPLEVTVPILPHGMAVENQFKR
jgi:hypothetical protein